MILFKTPLRTGSACGLPIIKWTSSSDSHVIAKANVFLAVNALAPANLNPLVGTASTAAAGFRLIPNTAKVNAKSTSGNNIHRATLLKGHVAAKSTAFLRASLWMPEQPEHPRYQRYSQADYHHMLLDLMPQGKAWPHDGLTSDILNGWSAELHRIEVRGWDILDEWNPYSTVELFRDWERFFKLTNTGGLKQRRSQIIAKWLEGGALSRTDIDNLLRDLGIDATVHYWNAFMCGYSRMGDPLATDFIATWTVYVHNPGEVDLAWLEIFLNEIAPAQDTVQVIAAPKENTDAKN